MPFYSLGRKYLLNRVIYGIRDTYFKIYDINEHLPVLPTLWLFTKRHFQTWLRFFLIFVCRNILVLRHCKLDSQMAKLATLDGNLPHKKVNPVVSNFVSRRSRTSWTLAKDASLTFEVFFVTSRRLWRLGSLLSITGARSGFSFLRLSIL